MRRHAQKNKRNVDSLYSGFWLMAELAVDHCAGFFDDLEADFVVIAVEYSHVGDGMGGEYHVDINCCTRLFLGIV